MKIVSLPVVAGDSEWVTVTSENHESSHIVQVQSSITGKLEDFRQAYGSVTLQGSIYLYRRILKD